MHLTVHEELDAHDRQRLERGLDDHNRKQTGLGHLDPLHVLLNDEEGHCLGGATGWTLGDAFHISLLWVDEGVRGDGHGSSLLRRIEDEARRRGARLAQLSTWAFQAPAFYLHHGYEVFGELPDFPRGHTRYFLAKTLQPANHTRPAPVRQSK